MTASALSNLRNNLQAVLRERAISESELARQTGTQARAINRLVGGSRAEHSPTLETIEQLATGLGVSVAELLAPNFRPLPVARTAEPKVPPRVVRQVSRLLEDFLLCDEAARKEIMAIASARAEQKAVP